MKEIKTVDDLVMQHVEKNISSTSEMKELLNFKGERFFSVDDINYLGILCENIDDVNCLITSANLYMTALNIIRKQQRQIEKFIETNPFWKGDD